MTSYSIMLDAVGADAGHIPPATPKVAGYVTGTGVVPWSAADWALFPRAGHIRIDQSPALIAWATRADVADMENGAATEGAVIAQGLIRQAKGWWSWVYVSEANLAGLQDAAKAAGLTRIQYWVANWNLDEAEAAAKLGGDIVAVQWASPSSNPSTLVPGGTQTLAEANVDISVTIPSWFAYKPPVPAVTRGVVVTQSLATIDVTSADLTTWSAT
jgi:hypothetical protein